MNLNIEDITFVIVTHKSENIIETCLNSLPQQSKKIIVENSKNINLENSLKSKYDNIEVILLENIGMGGSNNAGIKKCTTKYAFVLNPDVKFREDTIKNLIESLQKIDDFVIASPLNSNPNFPNYNIYYKTEKINEEKVISVDSLDGFSMLINIEKFPNKEFFDENFFLYLENDDLCLRVKKNKGNIYIIKNSLIDHLGTGSSNINIEHLRNWHWMWSKFYFNKKHYGYITAFIKVFFNLISAIIKYLFYLLIFNTHKKKIYEMRAKGTINAMLGKKSFYRIKI